MQAGGDLRTLQTLGGWKRIEMVMRYAHSDEVHAAQAVARMVAAFPTPVPALVPALVATARVTGRKVRAMQTRA
jgi:hypothetical protein